MEVGMMFKKLARGAKFDTKRFLADAQKLHIIRAEPDVRTAPLPFGSVQVKEEEPEEDAKTSFSKKKRKKNKSEGGTPADNLESVERVKILRKSNKIHIWGPDLPDPVENFVEIPGISPLLLENIHNCAFEVPTAVQMQSIPIILNGRELLASAPTGSGKTAAFLIPIIQLLGKSNSKLGFRALVLSPTRELAKQIYRECVRLTEGTGLITSVLESGKKIHGDILISTPNRLVYQLKSEEISLSNILHLIVDECDHLFESGFVNQLGSIYSACDNPNIKRAFFSATCAYGVEEFCKTHLDSHILLTVGAKNAAGADLVEQSVIFTGTEAGKLVAIRDLLRKGIEPPVLVFVQSQERAHQLLSELVFEGVKCEMIHSGKSEAQRERIVEHFREGKIWILVCTALLSRGLDFPAVKLVINYDMPLTPVQYIHAIGRTGRAGRVGKAITFYTEDDRPNLRRTAQVLENSGFPVPPFLLKMKKTRKDEMLRPPKRARISKMAKYDVEKRFKHSEMVKHSKQQKQAGKETPKTQESQIPKKKKKQKKEGQEQNQDQLKGMKKLAKKFKKNVEEKKMKQTKIKTRTESPKSSASSSSKKKKRRKTE